MATGFLILQKRSGNSPVKYQSRWKEHNCICYEVYEAEFDGNKWRKFECDGSIPTNVTQPAAKALYGFDVVTFYAGNAPECSPLSCNSMAKEIPTNEHCLLRTFDEAYQMLSHGVFKDAEPGPYRIFAVYAVDWS